MRLDYEWTCPIFDDGIAESHDEIRNLVESVIDHEDIKLSSFQYDEFQNKLGQAIENVAELFENGRTANEDMRDAADDQMEQLNIYHLDTISDLENEIEEKQADIDKLEELIENAEEEVRRLQDLYE